MLRRCVVSGRVQGVFFRASTAHRARELGIRGRARNLADGRVEVIAAGEPAAMRAFMEWLWIGPSAARVTAVDCVEIDAKSAQLPAGFETA